MTLKKEKNILVISYYFPPLTGAPAWRSYSWARFFNDFDFKPTILTRHWSGNENTWEEHVADINKDETFEEFDNYNLYRLPSRKTKMYLFFSHLNIPVLRKIYFSFLYLIGDFNSEVNAFLSFRNKLKSLLKTNQYEAVIITGPPPNIYRLVNVVKKYSAAKVILDFRDLNNNAVISISEKFTVRERIINSLFNTYESRWMNKADLITTVTPAFQKYLQKHTKTKVEVVFNGYDNDFFDQIPKSLPEKFTISFVGAIYPRQKYDLILEGLKIFLDKNKDENIQVNAIGVLMDHDVALKFKSKLDDDRVYYSYRVPKDDAIKFVKNAHCLLFTSWDERPGMIPAKFYDYLASGTFIINCPGDQDIIDHILKESGAGITPDSATQILEILEKLYLGWKNKQELFIERKEDFIHYYSRKNQAKMLLKLIGDLK